MKRAGIASRSIYVSGPVAREIADSAVQHFSLTYIVAALDDPDLAEMTEEAMPARRRYLLVALVLAGNKPSKPLAVASAM